MMALRRLKTTMTDRKKSGQDIRLYKNNLLEKSGKGADDKVKGGHPDVVVSNDRAFLFYFTHPARRYGRSAWKADMELLCCMLTTEYTSPVSKARLQL